MGILGPDGTQIEIGPGEAFEAAPNHDAWVIGDETCIAYDWGPIEKANAQISQR